MTAIPELFILIFTIKKMVNFIINLSRIPRLAKNSFNLAYTPSADTRTSGGSWAAIWEPLI